MSRTLLAAAALGLSALPAAAGGFGCQTGQCYRETYVPPSYENVTERVMVRAPRTYATTTPAEYRTVQETVQVSGGGRQWSVTRDAWGRQVGCWISTPPRYATVSRTVMVRAPEVVPYAVPAQYGYRSYQVQTSAGYRGWAPISGGGQSLFGFGGGATTASYGGGSYGGASYGSADDGESGDVGGGYGSEGVGVGVGGFGLGFGGRGSRLGYGGRQSYGYGRSSGYGQRTGFGQRTAYGYGGQRAGYGRSMGHGGQRNGYGMR